MRLFLQKFLFLPYKTQILSFSRVKTVQTTTKFRCRCGNPVVNANFTTRQSKHRPNDAWEVYPFVPVVRLSLLSHSRLCARAVSVTISTIDRVYDLIRLSVGPVREPESNSEPISIGSVFGDQDSTGRFKASFISTRAQQGKIQTYRKGNDQK
jgi:hypothetical protein